MSGDRQVEQLLRTSTPQVLGVLLRRYGDFDACEDAVQEAAVAAAAQWPAEGRPENPTGWLVTVASRRLIDRSRQDSARRRREQAAALAARSEPEPVPAIDDTLTLLLLCCHPSLTPTSAVALTLRAVGGLSTAEIARALLVPEATVAQRISRAKQRIRASGAGFPLPREAGLPERIITVLHVLYLIFNEGSTASSGAALHRMELSGEAIRLLRQLHRQLPQDGEVAGLLALMLLTDARRPARTRPRRCAGTTCRAGPLAVGRGRDRRRRRASHRGAVRDARRSIPAAGSHRRAARRSGQSGRHRLGADPAAV